MGNYPVFHKKKFMKSQKNALIPLIIWLLLEFILVSLVGSQTPGWETLIYCSR